MTTSVIPISLVEPPPTLWFHLSCPNKARGLRCAPTLGASEPFCLTCLQDYFRMKMTIHLFILRKTYQHRPFLFNPFLLPLISFLVPPQDTFPMASSIHRSFCISLLENIWIYIYIAGFSKWLLLHQLHYRHYRSLKLTLTQNCPFVNI